MLAELSQVFSSQKTVVLSSNYASRKFPIDQAIDFDGINIVKFSFQSCTARFKFGVGQTMTLGRTNPNSAIKPEIDLSNYDSMYIDGVSRLHASLTRDELGWYLTDLNSTNGTWVNGDRLAPGTRYMLGTVNAIQFARFDLTITIPALAALT